MASVARQRAVLPPQPEPGKVVIESRLVERADIGFISRVFPMAIAALSLQRPVIAHMIDGRLLDLFMTRQTGG